MNYLNMIISFLILILISVLFLFASGSLSLKRLNLMSLSFYILLNFSIIGTCLIFSGFRNHYLLKKVSEDIFDYTSLFLFYSYIALPLAIIIFNRLCGIKNYKTYFDNYVNKDVVDVKQSEKSIIRILIVFTFIGLLALIYTFYKIGYIPVLKVLTDNIDTSVIRIQVGRDFEGIEIIRNIFALNMIPTLSFIAYIYYKILNKNTRKYLFVFLFLLSILCKTYNFEKAPVIIYLFQFYLIEIFLGNVKSIKKPIIYFALLGILFMIIYYTLTDFKGTLISISHGPLSRLFITQIATCYLHFQAFPKMHKFLNGASFPTAVAWVFNSNESWIRSGRVVMEIFNKSGVKKGVAGVMNSIYIAEAYANFGIIGVIISPWIVAFIMTIISNFILNQRKTPMNVVLYLIVTYTFSNLLVGGFVDFFYNIGLLFTFLLLVGIESIYRKGKIYITI